MAKESRQFTQRQFACGSRQTPDLCNQFLEKLGYYRKHTPTDSTCLFRVVSEQVYGVQIYHEKMRKLCVEYMFNNVHKFANDIRWDIKSYLDNMAHTHTYGSMVELKALALRFNANVMIFEPLKRGRWVVQSETAQNTWTLFRGRYNHFDSIFTLEYMRKAAYCQALVYEVLYKNVFRMPDVDYAVERMLYDPNDTRIMYEKDEQGRTVAITDDGRWLHMSARGNTDCVLTNSSLCHFHNTTNFSRIQRFFFVHGNNAGNRVYGRFANSNFRQGSRKPDPLLCDRNISCVRQLLNEGITPFAYKAAKALDANIYRNVEFDSWLDSVKTAGLAKMRDTALKVGMKCLWQTDGSSRVCRIESIQSDSETCLVRFNSASGLTCVRKETLIPCHVQPIVGRNINRNQTRNIEQPLREQIIASNPIVETLEQTPPPIDEEESRKNAQMLQMLIGMPVQARQEDCNPQLLAELNLSRALDAAIQLNMASQNFVYGGIAATPSIPMPVSPAVWQNANTEFSSSQQMPPLARPEYAGTQSYPNSQPSETANIRALQELQLHHERHHEWHPQQTPQEQHSFQQLLNQQQLQMHLQMLQPMQPMHQIQMQLNSTPFSIVPYTHQLNCPVRNCVYEIVLPVESAQQHLNQQGVGNEAIAGASSSHQMHGVFHYLSNSADPAPSATFGTTGTMMPYSLDSENARVYPGKIFFH